MRRRGRADARRGHHAWLDDIAQSGPFLTRPVLERAWPNGMPEVPPEVRASLRSATSRMLEAGGATRHAFIRQILCEALDWGEHLRMDDLPASLAAPVAEHGTVVHPDFAFYAEPDEAGDGEGDGTGTADGAADDAEADRSAPTGPYRLLGTITPWGTTPLTRPKDGWRASAVDRLAHLLRERDVPVGVTTDGRWWALVWARRGRATGAAVWDAEVWSQDREAFAAFVALLERARFLAAAPRDRLPALLVESLGSQEKLTDKLSEQVREAVELLVTTLDRLDAESGGRVLARVDDDALYSGAVTIMMRIVFLLFAEERRLLRSDTDAYLAAYSIGRLVEQLEQRAALSGEQALEHRTGAWHRLLATSRAVHGGVEHEDLRLPAYGSGLFDPDRHPWLEGRRPGEPVGAARPPAVDDRTMLDLLRAVQYVKVGGERRGERRKLTFRTLDVEQIGYVYEGLLELEVRTADEPVLHLARPTKWPKGKQPAEVPVSVAAGWADAPRQVLVKELRERTGKGQASVRKALEAEVEAAVRADLTLSLGGEGVLVELAANLGPLLRRDERGRPVVTRPGRRYLGPSTRRAATGTHYTPRWLAEDVASNALEPLCYRPGPLETADRDRWRIRPSPEILGLRVADIAMGSGAFLVAACRYLAERLVEAWDAEGREDATRALQAHEGRVAASDAEVDAVLLQARRLVAEHCLYGVDINPLAVDMAKLSLWLVTMDDERPFGFLDDRLVWGDSLLGLVSWEQLEALHVDPKALTRRGVDAAMDLYDWKSQLQEAADIRRRITAVPVEEPRDVEHKQRLLSEAKKHTDPIQAIADAVTACGVTVAARKLSLHKANERFKDLHIQIGQALGDDVAMARLAKETEAALQDGRPPGIDPRRPLHWPLEFPEVFVDARDPGFDAIIGNPPFSGGQKISGGMGSDYLGWLQRWDGRRVKGSADLAARFVLRANRLLNLRGQLGFIATNTLVQGDTLEVGLLQVVEEGLHIRQGRSSHKWPSRSANLEIVNLWASRAEVAPSGVRLLDEEEVPAIGPDLEPVGRVAGRPVRLPENEGIAFQGSNVVGLGFVMTPEEAGALIEKDVRNAEVLQPYIIGQDLNQRPDTSASRWIINFRDWSLERAEQYPDLMEIVRQRVKPERDRNNRANYRRNWWLFGEHRPGLYQAIAPLDHVLAISLVGSALMPMRVPTGAVFAHKCAVFAMDSVGDLAVLSSNVHQTWVIRYTSTMRTDINYSPSDVFDTFPRPAPTPELDDLGRQLDEERRDLMLSRSWGLTTTYNHVHDLASAIRRSCDSARSTRPSTTRCSAPTGGTSTRRSATTGPRSAPAGRSAATHASSSSTCSSKRTTAAPAS